MPRTNKNFENRKQEIAAQVWEIFKEKGFEQTTLAFIITKLKLNKGMFYHYFSSKEECLDFALKNYMTEGVKELKSKDEKDLSAEMRLGRMLALARDKAGETKKDTRFQYQSNDVVLRQKLATNNVIYFAPLFAEIIQAGNEEGVFHVENPLEIAEMLILLSNTYLEPNVFDWNITQLETKTKAFEMLINKILY